MSLPPFPARTGRRSFALVLGAILWLSAGAAVAAEENAVGNGIQEAAIVSPALLDRRPLRLPRILSPADAALYREVFALQRDGKWRAADKRIKKLDDKLLMGHVLAQRYLHSTRYRSRFSELSAWLGSYADHPQARRIHKLAMRRKPASARDPARPRAALSRRAKRKAPEHPIFDVRIAHHNGGSAERRLKRRIGRLVLRERLTAAENVLKSREPTRGVGRSGRARTRALIAAGWFRWGDAERALAQANLAIEEGGTRAPKAHFWAGLAAFRLKQYAAAAKHFETLAGLERLGSHERARAAFWAARAHLIGGRPELVTDWLERAASDPRDFYGLLAARVLGERPPLRWRGPRGDGDDIAALAATKPGRRALALMETGMTRLAERELTGIRKAGSVRLLRASVAVAEAHALPRAALLGARTLRALTGEHFDRALYPVPDWRPEGGFAIDRALIFALARQESEFNARARSYRGASGLMQLMPSTARYVAGSRRAFRGRDRRRLYRPEVNLALGQRYVDYLLTKGEVAGNLIFMVAAYNGGPGNIAKWQHSVRHGADPLIFIESIPLVETREFVKQVLANFWIYRLRLGQDAPTLTALASGRWPNYVGLDGARMGVAEQRP